MDIQPEQVREEPEPEDDGSGGILGIFVMIEGSFFRSINWPMVNQRLSNV